MKTNKTQYFLKINKNIIVDLSSIDAFNDMSNYLKLCAFTSSFESESSLIGTLKHLGLIPEDISVTDISIVKREGSKKQGYSYPVISYEILYSDANPFLNIATLRDFFAKNKFLFPLMEEIFSVYSKSYQRSIERLKDKSDSFFYKLCVRKYNNICRLEILLKHLEDGNNSIPVTSEYNERLKEFIEAELFYLYKDKPTRINDRGFVELARILSSISKNYEEIVISKPKQNRPDSKSKNNRILEPETTDPDRYMFLEGEDFENLVRRNSSKEHLESLEDQLANLEELKNKHRGTL